MGRVGERGEKVNLRDLQQLIQPLKNKIFNLFSRAVVRDSYDTEGLQRLKTSVLSSETFDKVERVQNYGFTARPLDGSEAAVICQGGNREHALVLGVDDKRYRKKNLEKGEVAVYTDEESYLHLKRGKELHTRATKFKFQGDAEELMDLLVQTLALLKKTNTELADTTTNTMLGPQHLLLASNFTANAAAADTLKTKLTALKV